ncbi:SdpI family protein [Chitinophaga rhizophila]|uniref:SdpI family protein n=1 Tax=Chitinophaga rhizophila TaxID=2866212 RepID=A0ABS7GCH3_9BACT|nr:SdpI family protein [Chitinophaga rhizophila]MBW8685375.1 SdpI family protein [Chitinophaga rhizophila]
MKKPDIGQELLLLLLLLLPMIYLGIIWPSLPDVMPTNFSVNGVADRVGSKSDFLLLMTFLFLTNLLLYFLFRYIPHVDEPDADPNEMVIFHRKYYQIRFMIHIYLAIFTAAIIFMASQGHPFVIERWVFTGTGLLIGAIGLFLRRVEPNYFVGVRTPWTLKSEDIWRETHAFAGNLWVCTGAATIIAGFFLPVVTGTFLLIFIGGILAALPYIYSYRLFNTDKG